MMQQEFDLNQLDLRKMWNTGFSMRDDRARTYSRPPEARVADYKYRTYEDRVCVNSFVRDEILFKNDLCA